MLLPAMPHSLFISDLHLSSDQPRSMAEFQHFVAEFAAQAEALYILGDLFEYWAGDDDLDDPFHAQVITALSSLTRHHTRVYLLHGNRDLLMGEALVKACHASLLDDPTLIELYGTPTLLSHGDTLCTDDIDYQRYREQVHDARFPEGISRKAAFRTQSLHRGVAPAKHRSQALQGQCNHGCQR